MINKLNFIIIGAQKSGTTQLGAILSKNSKLYMPKEKEVPFLLPNSNLSKNWDEVFDLFFSKSTRDQLLFTSSPQYMLEKTDWKTLLAYNQNIKFIAVLRDPIERLLSHFDMELRHGSISTDINGYVSRHIESIFEDRDSFKNSNKCIVAGEYGRILTDLFKYVRKDNIKIINFQKFVNEESEVIHEIFKFLDVPDIPKYSQDKVVQMRGGNKKIVNIDIEMTVLLFKNILNFLGIYKLIPIKVINFFKRLTYYIHKVNVNQHSKTSISDLDKNLLNKLLGIYESDQNILMKLLNTKEQFFDFKIYKSK